MASFTVSVSATGSFPLAALTDDVERYVVRSLAARGICDPELPGKPR